MECTLGRSVFGFPQQQTQDKGFRATSLFGRKVRGRESEMGKGRQPVRGAFQTSHYGEWLESHWGICEMTQKMCTRVIPLDGIPGKLGYLYSNSYQSLVEGWSQGMLTSQLLLLPHCLGKRPRQTEVGTGSWSPPRTQR